MAGDLHCHTRLSDGSLGIEDLIVLASKTGVNTIAITDHDCLAGTVRGKIIGERHGVNVIPGVELSAFDKKRKLKAHLLVYLSDSPDRLEGLCRKNSIARRKAGQFMILKAAQQYPLTPEFVLKCAAGSTNVFKQHIMHALMECGYTTEIYGDLYNDLFGKDSPNNIDTLPTFPDVRDVLKAAHDADGIAVLAHSGVYDDMATVEELIELGLDGVEVWHPQNTPEQQEKLIKIAKKNRILMTGGSGFHGMYNKDNVKLGDYLTPDEQVDALLNYKAKQKRLQRKAAAAAAAANK